MSKLTWGDSVRIKESAPAEFRPAARAAVVGIRDVETEAQSAQFAAPIGAQLLVVEFSDGEAIELAAAWVDVIPAEWAVSNHALPEFAP